MKSYLTIALLATLLCAGCNVGPDYKVPDVNVPGHFTETASAPQARADVSRWWASLNDQTLTWLVKETISSGLDIKVARSRIAQARAA